jgi:hypothetical protein
MIKQKLLIMNIRRLNGISELLSYQSLVDCLSELRVNVSELPTLFTTLTCISNYLRKYSIETYLKCETSS